MKVKKLINGSVSSDAVCTEVSSEMSPKLSQVQHIYNELETYFFTWTFQLTYGYHCAPNYLEKKPQSSLTFPSSSKPMELISF